MQFQVNYGDGFHNVYPDDGDGIDYEANPDAWVKAVMLTATACRVMDDGGIVIAAAHDHICLSCTAIVGQGGMGCEGDNAHDFELCDRCAARAAGEDDAEEDPPQLEDPRVLTDILQIADQRAAWWAKSAGITLTDPVRAAFIESFEGVMMRRALDEEHAYE